jgi:hypothetical protein
MLLLRPTADRRPLFLVALGFALLDNRASEFCVLDRHRPRHRRDALPGYDVQLTQYNERGWRATFYATGMEHSSTSSTGFRLGRRHRGAPCIVQRSMRCERYRPERACIFSSPISASSC